MKMLAVCSFSSESIFVNIAIIKLAIIIIKAGYELLLLDW